MLKPFCFWKATPVHTDTEISHCNPLESRSGRRGPNLEVVRPWLACLGMASLATMAARRVVAETDPEIRFVSSLEKASEGSQTPRDQAADSRPGSPRSSASPHPSDVESVVCLIFTTATPRLVAYRGNQCGVVGASRPGEDSPACITPPLLTASRRPLHLVCRAVPLSRGTASFSGVAAWPGREALGTATPHPASAGDEALQRRANPISDHSHVWSIS